VVTIINLTELSDHLVPHRVRDHYLPASQQFRIIQIEVYLKDLIHPEHIGLFRPEPDTTQRDVHDHNRLPSDILRQKPIETAGDPGLFPWMVPENLPEPMADRKCDEAFTGPLMLRLPLSEYLQSVIYLFGEMILDIESGFRVSHGAHPDDWMVHPLKSAFHLAQSVL